MRNLLFNKKYKQKQSILLNAVNEALTKNLNPNEVEILNDAKKSLLKSEYLPSVVGEIQGSFTPLAMRGLLSKDAADLYKKINSSDFIDKGLGRGIIMGFSNMFRP